RRGLVRLESRLFVPHLHRVLFKKYRPRLVITPSTGYWQLDSYIIREAKAHGARTVAVITNWDHATCKGLGGAEPDYVVAWSQIMKEELVRGHDIAKEHIFVAGVPIFDHYFRSNGIESRESFFQRLGLDPERKLIFFPAAIMKEWPNPQIGRTIAQAIKEKEFPYPCQLLIRLHPGYFAQNNRKAQWVDEQLKDLQMLAKGYSEVAINTPRILSQRLSSDMNRSEMGAMANILTHSDVVVCMFSTLNVEASIINRPVINIGFLPEGGHAANNFYSVERAKERTHNQRLIASGAAPLVESEAQLLDTINFYLRHPEEDAKARRHLVEQECGPSDGHAGERVGQHILSLLREA
ncbi:MAG: CDP-glycerol glycerophosphotransferase family protein, partial [Dehalococcoidia bacterium]